MDIECKQSFGKDIIWQYSARVVHHALTILLIPSILKHCKGNDDKTIFAILVLVEMVRDFLMETFDLVGFQGIIRSTCTLQEHFPNHTCDCLIEVNRGKALYYL